MKALVASEKPKKERYEPFLFIHGERGKSAVAPKSFEYNHRGFLALVWRATTLPYFQSSASAHLLFHLDFESALKKEKKERRALSPIRLREKFEHR